MPLVNPFHQTFSVWDTIVIAGIAYSGKAEVDDATRGRKVDQAKRSGGEGAHLVIKRRELAKPKITLTGWTQAHYEEMDRIARACVPLGSAERHNAVDVSHPALLFHAIDKVFVSEIDGPTPKDNGTFELVLTAHEWRPPPPRNASRRPTTAPPIATRATAFTGVEQPAPTPPSQTATPRRRTP